MSELSQYQRFFTSIENDPRINTTHISLYMGLLQLSNPDLGLENARRLSKAEVKFWLYY